MKNVYFGNYNDECIYTINTIISLETGNHSIAFDAFDDNEIIQDYLKGLERNKSFYYKRCEYAISNRLMELWHANKKKETFDICSEVEQTYYKEIHKKMVDSNIDAAMDIYYQMIDRLLEKLSIEYVVSKFERFYPFYDMDLIDHAVGNAGAVDYDEYVFEYNDYVLAVEKIDKYLKENTPDYYYYGYYKVVSYQINEYLKNVPEDIKSKYLNNILENYLTPMVVEVNENNIAGASTRYRQLLVDSFGIILGLEEEKSRSRS